MQATDAVSARNGIAVGVGDGEISRDKFFLNKKAVKAKPP